MNRLSSLFTSLTSDYRDTYSPHRKWLNIKSTGQVDRRLFILRSESPLLFLTKQNTYVGYLPCSPAILIRRCFLQMYKLGRYKHLEIRRSTHVGHLPCSPAPHQEMLSKIWQIYYVKLFISLRSQSATSFPGYRLCSSTRHQILGCHQNGFFMETGT